MSRNSDKDIGENLGIKYDKRILQNSKRLHKNTYADIRKISQDVYKVLQISAHFQLGAVQKLESQVEKARKNNRENPDEKIMQTSEAQTEIIACFSGTSGVRQHSRF